MPIAIASQYTQKNYTWTDWKVVQISKNGNYQYDDDGTIYTIYFYDVPEAHICIIWKNQVPEKLTENYSQEQNDSDKEDFENNFKSSANKVLKIKNDDRLDLFTPEPRTGKELILVTHNFSDPTTWYTESVRVTNETLSNISLGFVWASAHVNWIDMTHGKLFDEDALCIDIDHGYSIEVRVNGVVKQQREPFATSGGDYTVDYDLGRITFSSAHIGATVTASYSYENGSMWKLIPEDTKRIDIEQAEAQFSKDVILNDSILFDIYVYNPYDLPNKILYNRSSYKKMSNFIDEALGSYPIIPAIGGSERGTSQDIYGFPFRYGTIRKILSSQGTELQVSLKDNKKFDGEYATATFYCTVRDE